MKWIVILAALLLAVEGGMAQQHGDGGKETGPDSEISDHTHADVGLNKPENNGTGIGNKGEIKQKIENNNNSKKEQVREKIEERLKNKLQLNQGNGNSNNGTDKERKIKEKVKQAGSATDNAKQNYKTAQQKYLKAKAKQDEAQAHSHARAMMQTGINYIDTWLERIELQTLNSDLDNETKLSILNKIDNYRNDTKEEMEKVNNSADISQTKEIARELNSQWKDIRMFIKATGYRIAAGELEEVAENAGNLEPSLERMRSNANNTTRFDLLVSDYQHNLEMAEENLEQAQDVLANATTIQETLEGHKLVVKATNNLKQVFKDIRLIKNEFLA
ncbi:MAG: hypothetical protein R6U44_06135 [Archaeoglobaceae archaeon]